MMRYIVSILVMATCLMASFAMRLDVLSKSALRSKEISLSHDALRRQSSSFRCNSVNGDKIQFQENEFDNFHKERPVLYRLD